MIASSDRTQTSLIASRYQLLNELGSGGMGVVYQATDRLTGETVALKRVTTAPETLHFQSRGSDTNARVSLTREFQTLASLRHPHVINVLDYGFDEARQPYFTMTFLEDAQTIRNAAQNQPVAVKVRLLVQLLQALDYLHHRGVIHRDLKPGNVLVVNGQVKVLDFGLAFGYDPNSLNSGIVGTLRYMAPEVFGEQTDKKVDLYAVGVIAYELFAGKHPFDAADINQLIRDVLHTEPDLTLIESSQLTSEPFRTADDETLLFSNGESILTDSAPLAQETPVPRSDATENLSDPSHKLRGVIGQLLAKDPANRPENAIEVIRSLCEATDQPVPSETIEIRESFLQTAKFVGRDMEYGQLSEALTQAIAGKGSTWLVGGESGVGKSRLLEELRILALVKGGLALRGQAVSEGGVSYIVWRDVLRRLVLATPLEDSDASFLKLLVPDLDGLLERPVDELPSLSPEQTQERLIETIVNLFRRQKTPILLILEDLQWADESLNVLKRLNPIVSELPLLIVGSYRSDENPALAQQFPEMHRLQLERLSTAGITQLVESILGKTDHQQEIVALLQRETEGNAFFLVEVARALAEDAGQLRDIGNQGLPQTVFAEGVQRIIQRRLGRVPVASRPLLQVAAVMGRQFDLNALAQVDKQLNIDNWLTDCVNAAVINMQDGYWRFAHDKLREGMLTVLSPTERRELHKQAAVALESLYADVADQAAALAYHWGMAEEAAKEIQFAKIAGEQALNLARYLDAQRFWQRALSLVTADSTTDTRSQQAMLKLDIGSAYDRVSNYKEAQRWCEEGLALAREANDTATLAKGLNLLGALAYYQGDAAEMIKRFEESASLHKQIGDRQGEGAALNSLGVAYLDMFGQPEKAATYFEQALVVHREIGSQRREGATLGNLGMVYQALGDVNRAIDCYQNGLIISTDIGDRRSQGLTLNNLGEAYRSIGLLAEALECYQRAAAIHHEIGNRRSEGIALNNTGTIYACINHNEQAVSLYQQALTIQREIGNPLHEAFSLWNLGSLYIQMKAYPLALEKLKQASTVAEKINNLENLGWAQAYVAQTYLHTGQLAEAREVVTSAQEHSTPENKYLIEALHSLILARVNLPTEAQVALKEALHVADAILAKTPAYFAAKYTRGLILCGLAVLSEGAQQSDLLEQANAAYHAAYENCPAPGIVAGALQLLDELTPIDPGNVLAPVRKSLSDQRL